MANRKICRLARNMKPKKTGIQFESNAHWYDKDGKPCHDATLRDARKQGLYASPTTIDKDVFRNEFLEKYKLNQLAIAASETFRQSHEDQDAYINRIYELSNQHRDQAAEFGKELHNAVERYPTPHDDPKYHPFVARFAEWYDANVGQVIAAEKVLIDHDIGVAGRCDCIAYGKGQFEGKIILPDWKTQGVSKDEKGRKEPRFYSSWVRQLAFYATSYGKEALLFPDRLPTCISVVIDSNEPELPFIKVWTEDEIREAYKQFVMATWYWYSGMGKRKPYWPHPKGPITITSSVPML